MIDDRNREEIIKDIETRLKTLPYPCLDIFVFGHFRCNIFIACAEYDEAKVWEEVLASFTDRQKLYASTDENGNNIYKVSGVVG